MTATETRSSAASHYHKCLFLDRDQKQFSAGHWLAGAAVTGRKQWVARCLLHILGDFYGD